MIGRVINYAITGSGNNTVTTISVKKPIAIGAVKRPCIKKTVINPDNKKCIDVRTNYKTKCIYVYSDFNYCAEHPDDPDCQYCAEHPDDPDCQCNPSNDDCICDEDGRNCRPKTYCEKYPNSKECYCEEHPDDPDCNGCSIIDLPAISCAFINDEAPSIEKNLEPITSDPFGHFPDLKKIYVKDNDTVDLKIDNYDSNMTYYVYTNKDNLGFLFNPREPSNYAVWNNDDTVAVDIKDQLEGVYFEVWVWAISQDGECASNQAVYTMETMERTPTPYVTELKDDDECTVKIIIDNYDKDTEYSFELSQDDQIFVIPLDAVTISINKQGEWVATVPLKNNSFPVYVFVYGREKYKYKSDAGSIFIDGAAESDDDIYTVYMEFDLIESVQTLVLIYWAMFDVEESVEYGDWVTIPSNSHRYYNYSATSVRVRGKLKAEYDEATTVNINSGTFFYIDADNVSNVRNIVIHNAKHFSSIVEVCKQNTKLESFKIIKNACALNGTSGESSFLNCTNLKTVDLGNISISGDAYSMFSGCSSLENLKMGNVELVTRADNMFSGCSSLTHLPDLDFKSLNGYGTDYPEQGDLINTFSGMSSLVDISNLTLYSNIYNMNSTFYGCSSLTSIPKLEFGNVRTTVNCFVGCSSLFEIEDMYMPYLTNATGMFMDCVSLNETIFEKLRFSEISQSINCYVLFRGCVGFVNIPKVEWFKYVNDAVLMFLNCENIETFEELVFKGWYEGIFAYWRDDYTPPPLRYIRSVDFSTVYDPTLIDGVTAYDHSNANVDDFLKYIISSSKNYLFNYYTPKLIRPSDGYKRDADGNYVYDENGDKIPSDYGNEIEIINTNKVWST